MESIGEQRGYPGLEFMCYLDHSGYVSFMKKKESEKSVHLFKITQV